MTALEKIFVFIILAVILPSCRIQSPEFMRYEQPKYEVLGLQGVKVSTALVFFNPNFVRFKIKKIGFDVFVDGKKIAAVNDQPNIVIKPGKEFTVPVTATIKPEVALMDALKGLMNVINNREIEVKVIGNLEVKGMFIKRKVSFDVNRKLKME